MKRMLIGLLILAASCTKTNVINDKPTQQLGRNCGCSGLSVTVDNGLDVSQPIQTNTTVEVLQTTVLGATTNYTTATVTLSGTLNVWDLNYVFLTDANNNRITNAVQPIQGVPTVLTFITATHTTNLKAFINFGKVGGTLNIGLTLNTSTKCGSGNFVRLLKYQED